MTSRWLAAAAIWEARVEAERGEEEEVEERWVGGEKTQRGAMTERSADVNLSLALMSQSSSSRPFSPITALIVFDASADDKGLFSA